MTKFNAAEVVEALEFDFTAFNGPQGVIPEPSTKAINQFFKTVKGVMKDTRQMRALLEDAGGDLDKVDADKASAVMLAAMEDDSLTDTMQVIMVDAVAQLCGNSQNEEGAWDDKGTPTRQQIFDLPFRVQQAFTQWLVSEISPKKEASGTKG